LVKNLLDVTRIQVGKFGIKLEEINLSDALEDSIERFEGLLLEARCTVTLQIEKKILGFWDISRIEQVSVNLISNAIKYAPGSPV